ncbi:hypothetical protein COL80_02225 [Bacillus thuringiensis]|uniref:toll/interleukin-1 receptor domain-containing protein n=1 Tax=Bacillus thuringiensis TaxID=1428 RepID=UPI000BF867FF|nr:toll/interleukin-1 receptor domain-containing protein [Bacillus thuringiensis]PGA29529.1 hypothetical protein COL80_02225 [Bacillus thuringiensis]
MSVTKNAFISYSWDNTEHEQWVMDLTNSLRKKGVNATIDKFITQGTTTNLNTMMISNMRDNDYIIIVLTENYATKANSLQGGVGFETQLSLPILQENPEKLIFLLRYKDNFANAFPFHLKSYYAIDFSDDATFEDKLEELLHRIYQVPIYKKAPLGVTPVLQPRTTIAKEIQAVPKPTTDFSFLSIPDLKTITDLDKENFLTENYNEINNLLDQLLHQVQAKNPNFSFQQEKINNKKHVYKLYVNGMLKVSAKIWISSFSGTPSINMSFGNHIDVYNDNTLNTMINCEIDHDNKLHLVLTLAAHLTNKHVEPKDVIKLIWEQHLLNQIK